MFKALSLAAALAVLPISASAGDVRGPSEDAIEAAAARFEARMEAFSDRAESISEDETLSEAQREVRIAALWAEYQPDVDAFTAVVSEHAGKIAEEALADLDIDAMVTAALDEVEASGALNLAQGLAVNGAWASDDPEHMETMGLVAEYAVGEALDAVDAATADIPVVVQDITNEPDQVDVEVIEVTPGR
ncbi:hypothetical protein [Brevundimonas lenta]|uniref:Uncharacterized protein n=1 Tax=Brevundimonas lenta TaxID=424796 RepID=A0A7W6JAG4_9CAUL|nr:hypothetical protein [Brevundimonas lenta]MBB4081524.1 hypothetical protein [Brevundimonas lenta]